MRFTETAIITLYEESLAEAQGRLSLLAVAEGRRPSASGLNGWVFEQTIRYCLSQELDAAGLHLPIQEQVPLSGRARIAMLVGKVAIELKVRGSFGTGDSKYDDFRLAVEKRGWGYFYLTLQEGYAPYRQSTKSTFGADRAFFLDTHGDWTRFLDAVIANQA